MPYNPENKPLARTLRSNMTVQEKKLWYDCLRRLDVHIRRQYPFGEYIADFYCPSAQLIIELDGSQHYESHGKEADKIRDSFFANNNIDVIRYPNNAVNENFPAVCINIIHRLEERLGRKVLYKR